jgi:hypothetical protein
MSANPLAWVADSLKFWPEAPTLPDEYVENASPQSMAEWRNRLVEIAQVATELRRQLDVQMVARLNGAALRYGDNIIRAAGSRGRPKVKDPATWWEVVVDGLKATSNPVGLLSALYPANSVRLSALPMLAAAVSDEPEELREAHIDYELPTSVLSVVPISRAPKYLQKLEEGQTSYDRFDARQKDILDKMGDKSLLEKGPE